jgi:tetratricopeptide (TPR) repeat protein
MKRFLVILCIFFFLGSAGFAESYDRIVLKRDGTVLKGRILESNGKVVIRLRDGGVRTFSRDEVDEIKFATRDESAGKEGYTEEVVYILHLKDGSIVKGKRLEEKGSYFDVITQFGRMPVRKQSIQKIEQKVIRRAAPEEKTVRDVYRSFALDFTFTKPSPSWEFLEKPVKPLTTVQMVYEGGKGNFEVCVTPPPQDLIQNVSERNLKFARSLMEEETKKGLMYLREFDIRISRHLGAPVYLLNYLGISRIFKKEVRVREIRFFHSGNQYILRAYADSKNWKEVRGKLEEAFRHFSFIGPSSLSDNTYADLKLGYLLEKPSSAWTYKENIFDAPEKMPKILYLRSNRRMVGFIQNKGDNIELTPLDDNPSGRARVIKEHDVLRIGEERVPLEILVPEPLTGFRLVVERGTKPLAPSKALACIEDETRRRSKFFKKVHMKKVQIENLEAAELRYQDFGQGTRLKIFRILVAVLGNTSIRLEAHYPARGLAFEKVEGDFDRLFSSLQRIPRPNLKDTCDRQEIARQRRIEGEQHLEKKAHDAAITALTDAIKMFPTYALAYRLRGKAYSLSGDYKRAIKDFMEADSLKEEEGTSQLLASTLATEGMALLKKKQYEEAQRLLKRALHYDPDHDKYRRSLEESYRSWARIPYTKRDYKEAISRYKEGLRELPKSTRLKIDFINCYIAYSHQLRRENDLYGARRQLRKARSLDPKDKRLLSALERIESDIKKARERKKKKKK